MSEKSFAVASVSVAIIWGTFFYPPSPHAAKRVGTQAALQDVSSDALRADKGNLRAVTASTAMSKTANKAPAATAPNACAFAGTSDTPICGPLHKLAGD